jgi:hypothetical protein
MLERQIGKAAEDVASRLRRSTSVVPDGTVGKVKGKTRARFSTEPAEETVLGSADIARPEVPYQESYARSQRADALRAKDTPLSPQEQAKLANAPGSYPDMRLGNAGSKGSYMSGAAAQAMSDSRPFGRRMLNADQPDIGLGEVAQRSVAAERPGYKEVGNVSQTLDDVYGAYSPDTPGKIYDLPNEYIGLDPDRLSERLRTSGGQSIIDTRQPSQRLGYGATGSPYQDISARTLEDMSQATGNPMDEYLSSIQKSELPYDERTANYGFQLQDARDRYLYNRTPEGAARLPEGYQQTSRFSIPESGYVPDWQKTRELDVGGQIVEIPNVIIPRPAQDTVIDTLGGSELARRLRSQNPQAYSVLQDRLDPIAQPQQVDFRQVANPLRRQADIEARGRGTQLDSAIMAENAGQPNYLVRDVDPNNEFYLYGSQKDTQGNLPAQVADGSLTYGYQPSESLVKVGFNSRPIDPVNLPAGRVGLGVDITAQDPYSRAAVRRTQPSVDQYGIVRDTRNVPVDPITPIDLQLPGVRFAEAKGLQADITPEMAIYQDQQAATRLRAIADLEQAAVDKYMGVPREGISPDMQRRADNSYNSIMQAEAYAASAADMENAMKLVNAQTVPQPNVGLQSFDRQLPMVVPGEAIEGLPGTIQLPQGRALTSRTGVLPGTYRPGTDPMLPGSYQPEAAPGLSLSPDYVEMPFQQAHDFMFAANRAGAAQPVMRMPVVPTVAPEQTRLAERLRAPQVVGAPDSTSIFTDDNSAIAKALKGAHPGLQNNQLLRGVEYRNVPKGDTGQAYDVQFENYGSPIVDKTGNRMTWDESRVMTYNPREQFQNQATNVEALGNRPVTEVVRDPLGQQSNPEFGTRARATRPQVKTEEREQFRQAIQEGYVPTIAKNPMDQVILNGDDLADIRGGLSAAEAKAAMQHNRVRELMGLRPEYPDSLAMEQAVTRVPMADRSVELIRNPPAQGGVFTWGADDYGYGAQAASQFPTSGPPIQIQSGGMLNAFMTEPMPARTVRPTIRQVQPTQQIYYQRPAMEPSQEQPARYPGRADLDWQTSPSFRFPVNTWQGTQR